MPNERSWLWHTVELGINFGKGMKGYDFVAQEQAL